MTIAPRSGMVNDGNGNQALAYGGVANIYEPQSGTGFGQGMTCSGYLSNDSPLQGGGRESNCLVTVPRPENVLFFVFTAPEREFRSYENAFRHRSSEVTT